MPLTQGAHARAPSGRTRAHRLMLRRCRETRGSGVLAGTSIRESQCAGITVPWAHSCGAVWCGAHACTPLKSATARVIPTSTVRRTQSLCGRTGGTGRTLETPGEDPFLNGEYGAWHTQGLQA